MSKFDVDEIDKIIDKFESYFKNQTIYCAGNNRKINLGKGDKTVVVSKGADNAFVSGTEKTDSLTLKLDTDDVFFTKSGNNLILNRYYGDKVEKTVIKNYFKNYKNDKIAVTNGNDVIYDDVTSAFENGSLYLSAKSKSNQIKGTKYNDEAFSSIKDETFVLGKGNDVIRFRNDGNMSWSPYSFGNDVVKLAKGSHLTLDFDDADESFSYERKGNDCVITVRHRIEICGRSNGKEEWSVKKENDEYVIQKTKYLFSGDGYRKSGEVVTETMTSEEFEAFQQENDVILKAGNNTLYTSWPVVLNPKIRYSMTDTANWGSVLGSVILKNYFKYNEDSVYIGDKSLREFLYSDDEYVVINSDDSFVNSVNGESDSGLEVLSCQSSQSNCAGTLSLAELGQDVSAWQTDNSICLDSNDVLCDFSADAVVNLAIVN